MSERKPLVAGETALRLAFHNAIVLAEERGDVIPQAVVQAVLRNPRAGIKRRPTWRVSRKKGK